MSGQHRGHVASHNLARDNARVQYGDNHYHGVARGGGTSFVSESAQIMDSLSFAQMESRRDTISRAHMHTCKWLFDKQEYLNWRDVAHVTTHRGFFWIKSKPGAGKSTLMKFMVKSARRRMAQDTIIAFFFNARGGDRLETSLEGMYRSLLHQLLTVFPSLQTSQRMSKVALCAQQDWQSQTLETLFHDAVLDLEPGRSHLTCFIDALDECPEDDVRTLLKTLGSLSHAALEDGIDLHICFSSRHYPHITFEACQHLVLDGQEGHEQDISTYVKSELVGKGKLIEEMKLEIQRRAQGVFLWAELVVQILNKDCDRGNVRRLRDRLDDIPTGLDDLFRDILQRGVQEGSHLVQILQWILYAQRPLTAQEMYLAVHSGTDDSAHVKPWNSKEIEHEAVRLFILNSSKGLAELTKGTKRRKSTVQFIHESVRDYLRRTGFQVLAPNLIENLDGVTHEYLYICCCQWVSDDVVKHLRLPKDLPKAKSQEAKDIREHAATLFPFLEYCVDNLSYHAELAYSHGTTQIDILKTLPRPAFYIINNVFAVHNNRRHDNTMEVLADRGATGLMTLLLLSKRTVAATKSEHEDLEKALRLARSSKELKWIARRDVDGDIDRPVVLDHTVSLAIDTRNSKLLRTLGQYLGIPVIISQLVDALRTKSTSLIEIILDDLGHLQMLDHLRNFYVTSALRRAVRDGGETLLHLLLRHPALRAAGSEPDYPLFMEVACSKGYTLVVQSLLEYGVEPGTALPCHSTPLIVAARYGQGAVVTLLLGHGAVVDRRDNTQFTALGETCSIGNESVVRTPLGCGADVTLSRDQHRDRLVAALENNHESMVQLLLAAEPGVDRRSKLLDASLSLACSKGDELTVVRLLAYGANVNARCGSLQSPLLQACRGGHHSIARMLLESRFGAALQNASPQQGQYATGTDDVEALVYELFKNGNNGHIVGDWLAAWLVKLQLTEVENVVRMFMSEGLMSTRVSLTTYILRVASDKGLDDILQSLLRNGADLDLQDGRCYFDALSRASRRGHGLVVKTLTANDVRVHHRSSAEYGEVVQAVATARHGYILELLLDRSDGFRAQERETYINALRQATQLGFCEIADILHQRGVTLPSDKR
jgi:hypothetical protein